MIKQYFNLSLLLISSWTVYSHCQEDTSLPFSAAAIIICSLLMRIKTGSRQYVFFRHVPLSVIIIASFFAGLTWRNMYPPLEDTFSPFPTVTAALQSGSIFASILIWLKPFTKKNAYRLFFLTWLTVALSVNRAFTDSMLFIFCAFCIIAIAVVILHTMEKPKIKKHIFRYYRDFILFSVLLISLTTGLFYGISKTIVIFDQVFMDIISDYVIPRSYSHFLRIEPFMRLGNPGRSAWDKRPILEIRAPNVYGIYLKTQIFGDFDDGVWAEEEDISTSPLPDSLPADLPKAEMTMFTSFEHIVPSPYTVAAAKGNRPLAISGDHIVYAEDDQRTRILKFSLAHENASVRLSPEEYRKYTDIPPEIDPSLREISSGLVGSETDTVQQVILLSNYFYDNFRYSLYVDFKADNEGLISMIREKRPAYCTYFATAMTMLLRAQDIPARVATGFLADEKIDKKKNKFLARVHDAHAWVEVLIEDTDPETGLARSRWLIMDPTPSGPRREALKKSVITPSKIAENIWLAMLRFAAYMENLDKDKLKKNTLITLVLVILLINAKKIFRKLSGLAVSLKRRVPKMKKKRDPVLSIYHRYEHYLKTAFGKTRRLTETDREVLERLKTLSRVPNETIGKMESFVGHYQATRFGFHRNIDLEKIIEDMEQDIRIKGTRDLINRS